MDRVFEQALLYLLSGFIFVVGNYRFRYLALHTTGEKLILISAAVGVVFAVVGHIAANALIFLASLLGTSAFALIYAGWRFLSPFPLDQICAIALAASVACALNRRQGWTKEEAILTAAKTLGDDLEYFLETAQRANKYVLITLQNGRVYVGLIKRVTTPMIGHRQVCIVPLMSGHRAVDHATDKDGNTKYGRVIFNTYYEEIMALIESLSESSDEAFYISAPDTDGIKRGVVIDPQDMGILLPLSLVASVSRFDFGVYAFLNRERDPERWKTVGLTDAQISVESNAQE